MRTELEIWDLKIVDEVEYCGGKWRLMGLNLNIVCKWKFWGMPNPLIDVCVY